MNDRGGFALLAAYETKKPPFGGFSGMLDSVSESGVC